MLTSASSRRSFYIILALLFTWLSFFAASCQVKYGNMILCVLFLPFVVSFLADRRRTREVLIDKNDVFLWAYVIILTIGVFFARNKELARIQYFNYAIPALIIYYFFKSQFSLIENRRGVAIFISVLACAVSAFGILEFMSHGNALYEKFMQNPFYDHYLSERRVMSTQVVPQALGTYLLACLPMAYFLTDKARRTGLRMLGAASSVLLFCGIILSFTRSALISAMLITAVYFYKKNKKLVMSVLIIFAALVVAFSAVNTMPAWRLGVKGLFSRPDYEYRLARFGTTFRILKERPFLGVGLDNYRYVFDEYHGIKTLPDYWKIPDNMHLMILGESGILGYSAFMLFVLCLLIKSCGAADGFAFAVRAAIMGILFNMLTYDSLCWTTPFFIFWIYCGALASMNTGKIHEQGICK